MTVFKGGIVVVWELPPPVSNGNFRISFCLIHHRTAAFRGGKVLRRRDAEGGNLRSFGQWRVK